MSLSRSTQGLILSVLFLAAFGTLLSGDSPCLAGGDDEDCCEGEAGTGACLDPSGGCCMDVVFEIALFLPSLHEFAIVSEAPLAMPAPRLVLWTKLRNADACRARVSPHIASTVILR